MLVLPLDFFLFPFFSFFCPPQQLLKFLSMPFNQKNNKQNKFRSTIIVKIVGKGVFFFTSFFSLPSPAPGPMLSKTLFFVDPNCSVISQHWMGGRGIFSKRENFPSWRWKWTTVKLYNLPNYFYLAGIVVRRYSEAEGRCGETKKSRKEREP